MLVEKIIGKYESKQLETRTVHRVLLDETTMQKKHQRILVEDGVDIAITLGDTDELFDGAVLYSDKTQIVVVEAKEEKAIVIRPNNGYQWGKVCYNIGNMHHHAYLTQEEILVPYDHILETIISKLNVPYLCEMRKLTGERANISGKEHQHAYTQGQVYHHERAV